VNLVSIDRLSADHLFLINGKFGGEYLAGTAEERAGRRMHPQHRNEEEELHACVRMADRAALHRLLRSRSAPMAASPMLTRRQAISPGKPQHR
jgi:hypothetical protein